MGRRILSMGWSNLALNCHIIPLGERNKVYYQSKWLEGLVFSILTCFSQLPNIQSVSSLQDQQSSRQMPDMKTQIQ